MPLTETHKAVILATRNHPGLLAFHLYDQLGLPRTPEQGRGIEAQVRWMIFTADRGEMLG